MKSHDSVNLMKETCKTSNLNRLCISNSEEKVHTKKKKKTNYIEVPSILAVGHIVYVLKWGKKKTTTFLFMYSSFFTL